MAIIVIESSKGGSGKTTTALLLALQLAKESTVTIIDADPNQPLGFWRDGGNCPPRLKIISEVLDDNRNPVVPKVDENNILEHIEDAAEESNFVIIDLEGTAAKIDLLAISQADFVVIPMQGSTLDSRETNRCINVVMQSQKISRRKIPFAVLSTRSNSAIRPRTATHILNSIRGADIPLFQTELNEREAFRAVFAFQQTLEGLPPNEVSNIDKARENIQLFTHELLEKLLTSKASGAA